MKSHFKKQVCPVCGATKLVQDYEPYCVQPPHCEVCGADGKEVVEVVA